MEISQDERLEKRREAITKAAWSLFSEQGFERTALADVVDRAGGSLATLYKLFGNKTGLLHAVIEERARAGQDFLSDVSARNLAPCQALVAIGEHLQGTMLRPGDICMSRVVIAYSLQHPDFAKDFYHRTLAQSRRKLAELFRRWQDEGVALRGTPEELAAIFLGMFVYELHTAAISHEAASRPGNVASMVEFFCRGAGIEFDNEAGPDA